MKESDFLGAEKIQSEVLKEKVLAKFQNIYSSDREMVEGPVFPRISDLLSELTMGRSRGLGVLWVDLKFSVNMARSLKDTMVEHDRKNPEKTYLASGLFHALFFTHVSLEDRIDAGFSYAEALFEKDELEDKYRDSHGDLDLNQMFQEDGCNPENMNFYYNNPSDYHIEFDKEDLGDWNPVFESFRKQSRLTVEKFFRGKKGRELADLCSLMKTLAWRNHKVGLIVGEKENPRFSYQALYPKFRNIEINAALQADKYPEKSSEEGFTGYGYLSQTYDSQVEIHDEHRVEDKKFMTKIGVANIFFFAYTFNRIRRDKYQLRYYQER